MKGLKPKLLIWELSYTMIKKIDSERLKSWVRVRKNLLSVEEKAIDVIIIN